MSSFEPDASAVGSDATATGGSPLVAMQLLQRVQELESQVTLLQTEKAELAVELSSERRRRFEAESQLQQLKNERDARQRSEYQLAEAKMDALEMRDESQRTQYKLADERLERMSLEKRLSAEVSTTSLLKRRMSQMGFEDLALEVAGGCGTREETRDDVARLRYVLADEKYAKLQMESEMKKLRYQMADKAFDALKTKDQKDKLAFKLADAQLDAIKERELRQRVEYTLADERMERITLEKTLSVEKTRTQTLERRLSQTVAAPVFQRHTAAVDDDSESLLSAMHLAADVSSDGGDTPPAVDSHSHRCETSEDLARLKYVLADEKYAKLTLATERDQLRYQLADKSFDALRSKEERDKLAFKLADAQLKAIKERELRQKAEFKLADEKMAAIREREERKKAEYKLADEKLERMSLQKRLSAATIRSQKLERRLSQQFAGDELAQKKKKQKVAAQKSSGVGDAGHRQETSDDVARLQYVLADEKYAKLKMASEMQTLRYQMADKAFDALKTKEEKDKLAFKLADAQLEAIKERELRQRAEYKLADERLERMGLEKRLSVERTRSQTLERRLSVSEETLDVSKKRLLFQLAEERMDKLDLERRLSQTQAELIHRSSMPVASLRGAIAGVGDSDSEEGVQMTQELHQLRDELTTERKQKSEMEERLSFLQQSLLSAESKLQSAAMEAVSGGTDAVDEDILDRHAEALESINRFKEEMERLRYELADERLDKIKLTTRTQVLRQRASVLERRASRQGLAIAQDLAKLAMDDSLSEASGRDSDEDTDMVYTETELQALRGELDLEKKARIKSTRHSQKLKSDLDKTQYEVAELRMEGSTWKSRALELDEDNKMLVASNEQLRDSLRSERLKISALSEKLENSQKEKVNQLLRFSGIPAGDEMSSAATATTAAIGSSEGPSTTALSMSTPERMLPTSSGGKYPLGSKYRMSTLEIIPPPPPTFEGDDESGAHGFGQEKDALLSPASHHLGVDELSEEIERSHRTVASLLQSQRALQRKIAEIHADQRHIGVLFVAPYIHVKVLSDFIRNMKATHKARMYERYSDAEMKASGQVFNVLFSLLLICLKAKNSSAPRRALLKTRLEPYVRYIVARYLTDEATGSERLMTATECTTQFHRWLLGCCQGAHSTLSAEESEAMKCEILQLRKQLERATREKQHLRRESMLQVAALRDELHRVADGRIASATDEDSPEDDCHYYAPGTHASEDSSSLIGDVERMRLVAEKSGGIDSMEDVLKDKVNQLELDLADKDFDLKKARDSITPLKAEVKILREQLTAVTPMDDGSEVSDTPHIEETKEESGMAAAIGSVEDGGDGGSDSTYDETYVEEKMEFSRNDERISERNDVYVGWKQRAEKYRREAEEERDRVDERDASIASLMKWRKEATDAEAWKRQCAALKKQVSDYESEHRHKRTPSTAALHSGVVSHLASTESQYAYMVESYERMLKQLTAQTEELIADKMALVLSTSETIESLRQHVKMLANRLVEYETMQR